MPTLSRYEQIENAIIARLAPIKDDGAIVQATPQNQNEYERFFEKPGIVVAWKESSFEAPQSTNGVSQWETMHFEIYIFQKQLRGNFNIYDLYNRVRLLLVGFRPATTEGKFQKMWLVKFKPEQLDENMWVYCVTMATVGLVVEDATDDGYYGQQFPTFTPNPANPYDTNDIFTAGGTDGIVPAVDGPPAIPDGG
jgi:hypothetical protein